MIALPIISTNAPRMSEPQRPIETLSKIPSTTISARTLMPQRTSSRTTQMTGGSLTAAKGGRAQNSFWSFMAAPMSPLIFNLPVI